MTVTTDAVIIGGGVMGTSILYNLVSRGVQSPVLLERDTLGSGSTGRSSGAVRMHYSTTVNAHLAWESLKIFRNWDDAVGGGDCGFVQTGYMVFVPEESHDGLKHNIALQQAVGIETEIITKQEAQELAPAFDYADGESYAWEPQSGHADPSGTAMAYAARSREMGAEILLESPVTDVSVDDAQRRVSAHRVHLGPLGRRPRLQPARRGVRGRGAARTAGELTTEGLTNCWHW